MPAPARVQQGASPDNSNKMHPGFWQIHALVAKLFEPQLVGYTKYLAARIVRQSEAERLI